MTPQVPGTEINPADFEYVANLVRQRSAIVLEPGKEYLVEARLGTLARQRAFGSIADLVTQLRGAPGGPLAEAVTEAMTTNETSFFRDVNPFDALRHGVVPELLVRRASSRRLRIWCAASSSGQEPYTIAMVLDDAFPELRNWDVSILCTDLSAEMVDRCRAGRYSALEINRGLPAAMMIRYFEKQGVEYQVKPVLQSRLECRPMNLATPWPTLGEFDVIFIRNVLIYFDVETKRQIFGRLRRVLRPDGYLFLGAAETTVNIDDGFERAPFERAGCYRLKSPSLATSGGGHHTPAPHI